MFFTFSWETDPHCLEYFWSYATASIHFSLDYQPFHLVTIVIYYTLKLYYSNVCFSLCFYAAVSFEDVNECLEDHRCSPHATCSNLPGTYTCTCKQGYTGNGIVCKDINECLNYDICDQGKMCVNTDPGYQCQQVDGKTSKSCDSYNVSLTQLMWLV